MLLFLRSISYVCWGSLVGNKHFICSSITRQNSSIYNHSPQVATKSIAIMQFWRQFDFWYTKGKVNSGKASASTERWPGKARLWYGRNQVVVGIAQKTLENGLNGENRVYFFIDKD